jgi:cbb3-type cytochrome oxidase subunit 3
MFIFTITHVYYKENKSNIDNKKKGEINAE